MNRVCEGVVCLQSLPRLGFTANTFSVAQTLPPLHIDLRVEQGAYWHHSITKGFDACLNDGKTRYILTNDYDTPMRKEWVLGLYDILESRPDIAAVQGVQVKRGTNELMYRVRITPTELRMPRPADSDVDLLDIASGHFGLTLFRVDALRRLKKPWFSEVPDKDGGWTDHATHADIAFWRNMEVCGLKVVQANRILLPHIHEMVMWPTSDFSQVALQTVEMYERHGIPAGVGK